MLIRRQGTQRCVQQTLTHGAGLGCGLAATTSLHTLGLRRSIYISLRSFFANTFCGVLHVSGKRGLFEMHFMHSLALTLSSRGTFYSGLHSKDILWAENTDESEREMIFVV